MTEQLLTTGQIAALLGANRDRVSYVIRSRGIAEAARAGDYRLYDSAAVERIRDVLGSTETASVPRTTTNRTRQGGVEYRG